MMKIEIEPAVLAKLEEIAEQNQHLSPDEKEKLSEKIGRDTPELGVKMRELFADKKIYQSAQLAAVPLSKPQPEKADVGSWGKRRSLGEEDRLERPKPLLLAPSFAAERKKLNSFLNTNAALTNATPTQPVTTKPKLDCGSAGLRAEKCK